MIEIFKIKTSVESAIIGTFPQIEEKWLGPTNFWGENSYTKTPLQGPIEFQIIFPQFRLSPRGRLTDFVSSVNVQRNYLFISDKLWAIIRKFELDEHQQFDVPVYVNGKTHDFHLIYFPWPRSDDFIDWKESSFFQIDESGGQFIKAFENTRDYQFNNRPNDLIVRKNQITLFEDKIKWDVFRFTNFDSGFFVSKRLKEAMESAEITGVVYEPAIWMPNQPSWHP